jgi:hypothetical protein
MFRRRMLIANVVALSAEETSYADKIDLGYGWRSAAEAPVDSYRAVARRAADDQMNQYLKKRCAEGHRKRAQTPGEYRSIKD